MKLVATKSQNSQIFFSLMMFQVLAFLDLSEILKFRGVCWSVNQSVIKYIWIKRPIKLKTYCMMVDNQKGRIRVPNWILSRESLDLSGTGSSRDFMWTNICLKLISLKSCVMDGSYRSVTKK
jgi:hypothetical protein